PRTKRSWCFSSAHVDQVLRGHGLGGIGDSNGVEAATKEVLPVGAQELVERPHRGDRSRFIDSDETRKVVELAKRGTQGQSTVAGITVVGVRTSAVRNDIHLRGRDSTAGDGNDVEVALESVVAVPQDDSNPAPDSVTVELQIGLCPPCNDPLIGP